MKKSIKNTLICFGALFFSLFSSAQENYFIDLSTNQNKQVRQNVKSGVPIQLIIKNRLPNSKYAISIQKKFELLEELSLDKNENPVKVNNREIMCIFTKKTNIINDLSSEKKLSSEVYVLEQLLIDYQQIEEKKKESERDTLCTRLDITNAWDVINKTTQILRKQTLKKGCLLYTSDAADE